MIAVTLDRPWLIADLGQPLRLLSFAPHRPGFVSASRVLWREVRNADLTREFDAISWLGHEMSARGDEDAIGMLTSRNIGQNHLEFAVSGRISASCLATVGLTNAERVGHRLPALAVAYGTINLLAVTDAPLSDTAMIEAMTIAAEARTAAVITHGPDLPTGRATGTGTDCIVLGCPGGSTAYAGLHTDVGEALGRSVYNAVAKGTREWMETRDV
ncbi:adenosylcobinamide amidohydrolase [Roseibacterium beibuensis]|uniref:Adenosylcobinamide amidohydrolase CbiZ n=1 Tax=[Roseibacterium] beibuensis TaxID=1193142 RepID=A0ABP9LJ54_9RHOB|nr:adenosylcobinamide amidohydrolase [Roseibacterium beibuensis]MCS6623061.1 adenosylcobinamide amidohydrolase [Roseibacterium beibuensis]